MKAEAQKPPDQNGLRNAGNNPRLPSIDIKPQGLERGMRKRAAYDLTYENPKTSTAQVSRLSRHPRSLTSLTQLHIPFGMVSARE